MKRLALPGGGHSHVEVQLIPSEGEEEKKSDSQLILSEGDEEKKPEQPQLD